MRALELADERGELISYFLQRLHLCECALRAGAWRAAAALLDEWAESTERDLVFAPMYERCRALLAAGRGAPEEAHRWASAAIARSRATGVRWDWCEASRAHGVAFLLEQRPRDAVDCLRPVWAHTTREGVDEPGVFPVAPELVEALTDCGASSEAQAVADRLGRLATAQDHPWGAASATRSRAVVALARGRDDAQAAALADAAADYGRLGLRFDHARTLLTLGRAQRRAKQWGAAREALRAATDAFAQLESPGWTTRARAELDRVGARRARARGALTPTEDEIARLAAEGHSNKEIALALSLAVHTVEVHLSRVYAKLGINSRRQLASHAPAPDE